jgi:hypothetical protein
MENTTTLNRPDDQPVQTAVEVMVEELERVVAPGVSVNHNETFRLETDVEELEPLIAPGHNLNHNETFLTDRDR